MPGRGRRSANGDTFPGKEGLASTRGQDARAPKRAAQVEVKKWLRPVLDAKPKRWRNVVEKAPANF